MKRRAHEKIYKLISMAVVVALLAGSVSAATPVTVRANVSQSEEVVSANAVDTTEEQSEKVNSADEEIQSEAAVQDDIPRALTYRDVEDPVPVMRVPDGVVYANRGTIPAKYDPVTEGKLPSLKDQGSYGTCWAFAAVGASEAGLITQGKADTSIDLSERHLAYFFYEKGTTGDAIGGTTGDYNTALLDEYYSAGGNSLFTMWHLASWAGLVNESVAPYEGVATPLTSNTANVYGSSAYHLQNAHIINKANADVIKQTILDYGAMAAAYYSSKSSSYDHAIAGDYGAYYYNVENSGTNHAIQIVGWDDDYPASNFAITPDGNGAWLVKNSWDNERENEIYAQNGYFWISYYDACLTDNFYAFICEPADNYDNIYQYDGAAGTYYYATRGAANVFEVQANNGKPEILQAVGIGNYSNGVDYTLTIYKGLSDGNNPTSGTKMLEQTGTLTYSGYNTVELDSPITVSPGEKVAVVWTFDTETNLYVDYEYQNGDWLNFTTEEKSQTSYYRSSTSSTIWYDMTNSPYPMTFRIKAYTDNVEGDAEFPLQSISLSKTSAVLEPGGLVNLIVTYDPLYTTDDTTITWSSSNETVATVENGVVRAVSPGTAVITATCGTKTATCTVTVKEQKLTIQNKNNTAGTCTIRVARVNELSNVSGVKVAVWSVAGGQDDLKWYTATHQGNGVYTLNMNIANHGSTAGEYACHAYVNYTNGSSPLYATGGVSFTREYVSATSATATVSNDENTVTLKLNGTVGASSVKFAVWSNQNGQDDLRWYAATNQGDGTWSVTIPLSNHKYMAGGYQVQAYAGNAYASSSYVKATSFSLVSLKGGTLNVSNINAGAGTFRASVSGISAKAGVKSVRFAVWSRSDQRNLRWYNASRQSDGSYAVNVNLANHGYEYGTYIIHAYVTDGNGLSQVVSGHAVVNQPKAVVRATGNGSQAQFNLKASNVGYAGGVSGVRFAVWSLSGGQDDLRWYDATNNGSGTWSVNISPANHGSAGTYAVHMYIRDSAGGMHHGGTTDFVVQGPSGGKIETYGVDAASGMFGARVNGVNAPAGVREVRFAVWSRSNQSNLYWYTATRQSDGTFPITVDLRNHGYEYGGYIIHAYVTDNNGITSLLTGGYANVSQPKAVVRASGNGSQAQFNLKASNVGYAGGVSGVRFAVWSLSGGQDDLRWYDAANNGNNTWSVNMSPANHGTAGTYAVHMYIRDSAGGMHHSGTTDFVVQGPTGGKIETYGVNASAGMFGARVSGVNAPAGVREVRFAVWSKSDQSNLRWYTASKQSDGTFPITVDLKNHGYEYGTYIIHAYVTDNNGITRQLTGGHATINQPKAVVTSILNSNATQCTIKTSNVVYVGGVRNVEAAVWSVSGGQDDLVWYSMRNATSNTWLSNVIIANHKSKGAYLAHVYITDSNGNRHMIGQTSFLVP